MTTRVPIDDLKYELQLLLGAAEIVEVLEKHDKTTTDDKKVGNLINYFKDSAYLHIRNIYNFFAADTRNDAKVTQYINTYLFDLTVYHDWIDALHDHALHIKTKRGDTTKSNIVNGTHLNEMVPAFAKDIKNVWQTWVDNTADNALKSQLGRTLSEAEGSATHDSRMILELIK